MTGSKQSGNKSVSPRSARLARDADGDPLGSAVFLDADDLHALVDGLDGADRVAYRVEGGTLRVDADADGGERQ